MHIEGITTDAAVLAELGRRLERHRLERNWTQAQMAAEAGVGQATVQRAEGGRSVQMTSMVKLLRALDLLGGLDAAVPETIVSPIAQLERERRAVRRRASGRRGRPDASAQPGSAPAAQPWRWGDQQSGGSDRQGGGSDQQGGRP